jgi:hypothetical protein
MTPAPARHVSTIPRSRGCSLRVLVIGTQRRPQIAVEAWSTRPDGTEHAIPGRSVHVHACEVDTVIDALREGQRIIETDDRQACREPSSEWPTRHARGVRDTQ